MKKYTLAILMALMLLLIACGGDDLAGTIEEAAETVGEVAEEVAENADEVAETVEETVEDVTEAMDGDVTLNAYVGGANDQEYLDWAKAEFEGMHPGVTVNFVTAGEVVEDRLGIYLQIFEAQSPELDVAQIDVIWPGDLAEHFVDLNDYGAADVSGAHFPAIVENNTVNGSLVGIPYFTDAGLLYYRTDLLEKYGYDAPPATWDDLEEMAAAIQDGERADNPDFDGFVWQGRAYEGLTCDALEWIDSHGGGTIVSPDGTITINNQNAIDAIERAAGWVGTISPAGVTDYAEEDARGQWQAGNAAFMRNWPYAYSLGNGDDSPIAGNFAVAALPAGPASDKGSATLGGWQLAVSKYSAQPELSAELALFLASEDSQRQNAIITSKIPTIMSLYEDAEVIGTYPWFSDLLPVFTSAAARPSTATAPQYSDTSALFFTAVNSVLIGEKDADEALAELELELEDLLGFPTGAPSGMTAADEMAEESMEEFDVNITVWADEDRTVILNKLKGAFQDEYGVGLIVEEVADIYDQFPIAAPAGEGPDILILAHDRIGGFYASGLLAPIDLGGREGEFYTEAINAFTYEGELVGMPYAVENLGFFYNTDLVDGAPATWDEAMEVGGALVDSGDATYAIALTGTTYDMFPLQTAFGGYVFGRGDAGYDPSDVGIDSPGMIAAGDFIATNIEAGYISNSTDWDTAHLQFETGEIPFLMAGPWALDRIRESGVNYAIAGFPDGGQPFLGVQGFAVNALSENVLLAQAFLTEFVATEEVMSELAASGNRPSAHRSVVSDDSDLVAMGVAGENALPMPAIPEMGSVWGSWGDAFTLIMNGEQTAEEALTNGAAQIRDLIGGAADGMVNVPGSWQSAAGFDCEWDPACADTALVDNGDGTFSATFDIPAGEYEVKVALDGAWTENYGVDGAADGDNYTFSLDADSSVTFTFDSETKLLSIDG